MAAITPRRSFVLAGLFGVFGLAAMSVAPQSDSVAGMWRLTDSDYPQAYLLFKEGGEFWFISSKLLTFPNEGTWRELPDERIHVTGYDGTYTPQNTRYFLESDPARPPDATFLHLPAHSAAIHVCMDDERFLILREGRFLRIHGWNRSFRRNTWFDTARFRVSQWWDGR